MELPHATKRTSSSSLRLVSPRNRSKSVKDFPQLPILPPTSTTSLGDPDVDKSEPLTKKMKEKSLKKFLSPGRHAFANAIKKSKSMECDSSDDFSYRERDTSLSPRLPSDFDKDSEKGQDQSSSRENEKEEESEEILISFEATPENISRICKIQNFIRKVNAQFELDRRVQYQIQRTHIFYEIVDTEETYVQGLTALIEEVYDPLSSAQKLSEHILDPLIFKSLFPEGHIKIIYTAHKGVIEEFRQKRRNWSHHQTVGDVFLMMCDFLRLYTRYAETYSEVEDALENLKKEKKFMAYLKEKWLNVDPIAQLSSLLITPIQRIPRYQMLLGSLYKYTWESHRDFEALGTALEEMIKTARHVNDKAKEADNAKKLVLIDASLFGMKSKVAESIVAANRKFVKEGFLNQWSEKGEWKKRYFFLLSDLLIRTRTNRKQKGAYIFIEKVNLKKLVLSRTLRSDVKDLVTKEYRSRCFEVYHSHPIRYVLAAPSIDLKNEWCMEFERVLSELLESEAKHEEAVKKISSKKAHVAKSLISQSLMQHATVNVSGENCKGVLRERRQTTKMGEPPGFSKSKSVDATRAFAEHMALAKMSPQERWETAKKAEDVQNWEKLNKKQQLQKEEEYTLKKKEIKQQLNNLNQGQVRNYRDALAQYKQMHQDNTHL